MELTNFSNFVTYTLSQEEVSVIIAEDTHDISLYSKLLQDDGFTESFTYNDLLAKSQNGEKTYYLVNFPFAKEVYDFIVQYPTGRIQIFDTSLFKSVVTTLSEKKGTCIFLLTQDTLTAIQKQGYDVLSHVGITYRKEQN